MHQLGMQCILCMQDCTSLVPVLLGVEVGEAHSVVHAAAHQHGVLVHHHLIHLVGVALPLQAVVLAGFSVPIKCRDVKEHEEAEPHHFHHKQTAQEICQTAR